MLNNHLLNPTNSNSKKSNSTPGPYSSAMMQDSESDWYTAAGPGQNQNAQHAPHAYDYGAQQPASIYSSQQQTGYAAQQPMGAYGDATQGYGAGGGTYADQSMGMGGNMTGTLGSMGSSEFDDEPPLLEELGIHYDQIWAKTRAVMYPMRRMSDDLLNDADLAGPLIFCLMLGSLLLLAGKIHFGVIYGFSMFGCVGMNLIIKLIHRDGLDIWRTCSVLGYCLIPVIGLAAITVIIDLRGYIGFLCAIISISWSTAAATRLLDAKLHLTDQYWLVAYPTMLLYSCFVLITIF